jgi:cytochrome bd-type quinol oxidase subunit 2
MLSSFAAALLLVPALPAVVSAQDANIGNNLCNGANLTLNPDQACTSDPQAAQDSVDRIIKLVINIFSLLVGVVSVIMIIIGGLKYITSGGEGSNITGAKNTILYAIIGLVVVALAQVIVRFVLAKATTQ